MTPGVTARAVSLRRTQRGIFVGDTDGARFGHKLSFSADGHRLALAAMFLDSNAGFVRIYDWDDSSTTWSEAATLYGHETCIRFGQLIALSPCGCHLAVVTKLDALDSHYSAKVYGVVCTASLTSILPTFHPTTAPTAAPSSLPTKNPTL